MRKYVIERTVPGAVGMTNGQLAELAGASNEVLRGLGTDIQWIQSQVVDDKIYCLYARTGTTMWSYATNQGLYASPAIWNNTIYIGSKYRCFWAIDVRNGKPTWSASAVRKKRYPGPIYGSATVLKGVVYFSTLPAAGAKHTLGKESGKTYAIDARSGKLKWSWAAGAYSPVTATSSLILLTGHHTIYAFKPRR